MSQCGKTRNSLSPEKSFVKSTFYLVTRKTIIFTKYLPKMRERVPVISTLWIYYLLQNVTYFDVNFAKSNFRIKTFSNFHKVMIRRKIIIFTEISVNHSPDFPMPKQVCESFQSQDQYYSNDSKRYFPYF